MALLTSAYLQVHAGVIHAVVELLYAAGRPLDTTAVQGMLQPQGLEVFYESDKHPPNIVPAACEVATWLGFAELDDGQIAATETIRSLNFDDLDRDLPRLIRQALFDETRRGEKPESAAKVKDLVDAIAWFLAQDAWNPPMKYEGVVDSAERRQIEQFAINPELVNETKWVPMTRWTAYLGLGALDPITGSVIPDPTRAIRDEVRSLSDVQWPAGVFVAKLAERLAVLDGGTVRSQVMGDLRAEQLPWENRVDVLSPSLTLALLRLQAENVIELISQADGDPRQRRALSQGTARATVDQIRRIPPGGR